MLPSLLLAAFLVQSQADPVGAAARWCTHAGEANCILGVTPYPPPPPPPPEIVAVLTAGAKAWSAGDLDGFMTSYASSATFLTPEGQVMGREAIKRRYLRRYGGKGPAAFGSLTYGALTSMELGSPDWVVVYGDYVLIHDPSRFPDHGVFDLIMHKSPEGWRIVSDHTS